MNKQTKKKLKSLWCPMLFSHLCFPRIIQNRAMQLLLTEADRWCNTTETTLKSSELQNKSMPFTQHRLSTLMPSVRACLVLGQRIPSIIQLQKLSQMNKAMHAKETSTI